MTTRAWAASAALLATLLAAASCTGPGLEPPRSRSPNVASPGANDAGQVRDAGATPPPVDNPSDGDPSMAPTEPSPGSGNEGPDEMDDMDAGSP
jgi:hypothetical protein